MARIYLDHETTPNPDPIHANSVGSGTMEMFTCPVCGKEHEVIYRIRRALRYTLGHFPAFRINGEDVLVDGTLPHHVRKLPRDAVRIPDEIAHRFWTGTGHYFGEEGEGPSPLPSMGERLRDAVAELNRGE